jgi:acyl dehydratase
LRFDSSQNEPSRMAVPNVDYATQYNAKDVILYALSIGLGSTVSKYDRDLRYTFEGHDDFMVFPTFAVTLMFWASTTNSSTSGDCSSIRPFPPPLMNDMGVIPAECLLEDVNLDEYPVIHTSQSIYWKRDLPIPRESNIVIRIKGKFLSVIPKSAGTFVTTEFELFESFRGGTKWLLICSVQSTALILGIAKEAVQSLQRSSSNCQIECDSVFLRKKRTFLFESDCCISPNTALLYRLASGDTNHIHVDSQAVKLFASSDQNDSSNDDHGPLLHGLCTLSIAARYILQFLDDLPHHGSSSVRYLSANFVKPVFMNDVILVQAWELEPSSNVDGLSISFTVRRKSSGLVLLDNGRLQLQEIFKAKPFANVRSNL